MQQLSVEQLIFLHNTMNRLCPIEGITQQTDGEIQIHWGAGATPPLREDALDFLSEWEPPQPPNWRQFLEFFLDSPIDLRLQETSNQRAYYRLQIAFNDRDTMRVEEVLRYWQAIVYGMEEPLQAEEIEQINQWAEQCHLPLRVGADGLLLGVGF